MRIFPFNTHYNHFHNYSNYLNWLALNIISLKDYLKYFNPDYTILNGKLEGINIKDWESSSTQNEKDGESSTTQDEESSTTQNEKYLSLIETITINDKEITLLYPAKLNFREGVITTSANTYACFSDEKATNENWNKLLLEGKIVSLKISQVIFSKKWSKNIQHEKNQILLNPSSYLIMSLPQSAIYTPQSISKGLKFTYIPNGPSKLGANIYFSLEFEPSRYFLTDDLDKKWTKNSIQWTAQGAFWASENEDPTIKIKNTAGQMWNNSYPLMHKIYLMDGNQYEEFIVDNFFETEEINIANHNTIAYNINTLGITQDETSTNLWEKIYISII